MALELKKPIPRGYAKQVVREIIIARLKSVQRQPQLIEKDPWDLSDIFYKARKRLDAEGYNIEPLNDEKTHKRKELYHYVKEYCDSLGIKRHQIGIFPADRAVLAFQGELYSVSFKNYKELAKLGTDVICIEKAGLVDKLAPFTKNFGIALLHSQGFLSEYGEWLAKEAVKKNANVIILTDFDASGIEIAFQIEGVTRLGVDLDTIEWLNNHRGDSDEVLDQTKLQESCTANSHWESLKILVLGYLPGDCTEHEEKYVKYLEKTHDRERFIDFLKNKRIELNTIENEIGAQRFWEWLKSELVERFPNRNYSRAISTPRYILTPIMEEFNEELESILRCVLRNKVNETESRLKNTEGLLDTNDQLGKIESGLLEILSAHPLIRQIDLGMKALQKQMVDYYSEDEET